VDLREAKPFILVGKMVEVSVQYNRIIAHDVNLGERFADLHGDVMVDKTGRVQVLAEKMRLNCDLDSLGNDVLEAIEDLLSKDNELAKRFHKLKTRVHRHLAERV
jgi:hypothetical protein